MYIVYLAIDRVFLPNIVAGAATIEVPKITGLKFNDAQKIISNKGLDIEIAKEVYNESLPAGSVVTQVPVAESVVKKGRYIFVTISKGKELVQVPYITGMRQRSANINLMQAGFELGRITYEFSENVAKDMIISQSHKPGARIPYGEKINIVISKGSEKQIKIPFLIGLLLSEATKLLDESDLILGNILFRPDGTYLPDVVIEQSPNPGEIATPQTVINITVAQ
jgi:serine/threonine-protein kinase